MDQCLAQLIDDSKLAVAISIAHAYDSSPISPSQIYCFDGSETIHDYTLKFLVRKNFTYMNQLNAFIQMSSEGGLIKKWYSNSSGRTRDEHFKQLDKQINLKHFHGLLAVEILMKAFTICMFLFEKYVYMKMQMLQPHRLWVFVEMIIDPDRHFMLENKFI